MHGWSGSLINVPYGAYLDHCYAWNLQTHFLRVFVANLKNDAIYGFYPESFCDKNLAIRKVFAFSDSGRATHLLVPWVLQFYIVYSWREWGSKQNIWRTPILWNRRCLFRTVPNIQLPGAHKRCSLRSYCPKIVFETVHTEFKDVL